jgi:hypothetical protein
MAEAHVAHHEQRREGMLGYSEGCYTQLWRPHPELPVVVVVHPLQVGDRFEVQVGGQWQAAILCRRRRSGVVPAAAWWTVCTTCALHADADVGLVASH